MEGSKYWESVNDNQEFVTSNPDLLAAPKQSSNMEDKGLLESGLSKLTIQQRWLIVNYFGVFGHTHKTYQELATELNISRQAVAKQVRFAIRKLRKSIRKMGIEG